MSDGGEALAEIAATLRSLKTLPDDAAREAAPLVEAAVKATAAAGTSPTGQTWGPKNDGGRALPNAAGAITAKANGPAVILTLVGGYVYHALFKKRPQRDVLPVRGEPLPPSIRAALLEGATRAFRKRT